MAKITFTLLDKLTLSTINSVLKFPSLHTLSSALSSRFEKQSRVANKNLWSKEEVSLVINSFKEQKLELRAGINKQQAIAQINKLYDFTEYSVLLSEVVAATGCVHNFIYTNSVKLADIGFGELLSIGKIKYYNFSEELVDLCNSYDYVYIDKYDPAKELYEVQLQIKTKYLSFGNN